MRPAHSEILPLWRSWTEVVVLYSLLYGSGDETASDIAARFELSRPTVNDEVRHLEQAGLVTRRLVGRSKLLTVVPDHPAIDAIRMLVDLTIGPIVELRSLYEIEGVERVAIFGSWARRHRGERGPRPGDVDVLVIGDVDSYAVLERCLPISGRLAIAVNPIVVSAAAFANPDDDVILAAIVNDPLVEVSRP